MTLSPPNTQRVNRIGDALILVAGSLAATTLEDRHWIVAVGMSVVSVSLWLAGSRALLHYDPNNGRGARGNVVLTLVLLAALLLPLAALREIVPSAAASSDLRRFLCLVVPLMVWLRLLTSWLGRREVVPLHVLVVGIGPLGRNTGRELRDRDSRRLVVGYLRFEDEAAHWRLHAQLLGTAADLEAALRSLSVDEVYVAGNRESQAPEMERCVRICERLGVPFALPASSFRFSRARPVHERALADGYVHYSTVRYRPVQTAVKRAVDVLVAGTVLVLLAPLLFAAALGVAITSRGPILFRQVRVGQRGRSFNMLKFRSMVHDAEARQAALVAQNEVDGPVFKVRRDPRVTPLGRVLRRYSIDELPQLVNVLRGDMTLVGPRPALPSEVAKYEPWQRRRLSVRPGITCVWQVSGRNQIGFEDWMYLDMQYIDHWTLLDDLRLLLKTVPAVLTGRGAS